MRPLARYLPPWLGWTRALLASVCLSNPHQGIPSTTVTAPHMTQGTVQYESMIPQGMDEGLDLWEASLLTDEFLLICQLVRIIFLEDSYLYISHSL
jgi:hypothetical protein